MANVVIDILAEFTGKKAFKQAESATSGLEKGVKRLGKQIAGVFAAQKILQFGKASIKAFAADEKASKSLEIALRNTGNAFETMNVEGFIAKLQRTTGVLDDELRPAFRTLLTATGDVKKSQEGLQLALDISAGTGKDLSAVSMALAKAYGGQTTALSRLGAGLDKATLKTGNMDVILGQLNDKFSGQALAAVKTYSGEIAVLNVALQNAKETIGKGLLDSFAMLAGSNGLQGSVTGIQKMADFIADVTKNVAYLIKQFEALKPAIIAIGAVLLIAFAPMTAAIVAIVALLAIAGKNLKKNSFKNGIIPGGMGNVPMTGGSNQNIVKDNNALKTHTALQKIDNGVIKDKIQMTAGEKALAELKKIFDKDGIELQAALNNSLTKEEEARVKGLIAIHNSDGAMALQAIAALKATDALEAFRQQILTTIKALIDSIKAKQSDLMDMLGITPTPPSTTTPNTTTPIDPSTIVLSNPTAMNSLTQGLSQGLSLPDALSGARYAAQAQAQYSSYTPSVNITISPAVAGLIDVIQNQSASGISPTVSRVNSSYIA